MILLLFCSFVFAQGIPGETIYSDSTPSVSEVTPPKTLPKPAKRILDSGNLPKEYPRRLARESNNSLIIMPPNSSVESFDGIKVGDSISVSINHSILAFPDEPTPVVATGTSGATKNIRFVGHSKLEANTKRIFIEFNQVVVVNKIFHSKGIGVSDLGQPGLIGEYHSREAEYFTGDFISSFAAGYFDGLVPRHRNIFGQSETDSSVDTAVKKGLASSSLSSADRFKEKLKKIPEFSELKGPLTINILFLEKVITKK